MVPRDHPLHSTIVVSYMVLHFYGAECSLARTAKPMRRLGSGYVNPKSFPRWPDMQAWEKSVGQWEQLICAMLQTGTVVITDTVHLESKADQYTSEPSARKIGYRVYDGSSVS